MAKNENLQIKLTKSVKLGEVWKHANAVVVIPSDEANRLIRLGAATDHFSSDEPGGDQSGSDNNTSNNSDNEIDLISLF